MSFIEIIAIATTSVSVLFSARLIFLYAKESKLRLKAERANRRMEKEHAEWERFFGLPAEDVVIAIKEYKIRKEEKE